MKVVFWQHPEHKRERDLAEALKCGAEKYGDTVDIKDVYSGSPVILDGYDAIAKVGVKSRDWFRAYRKAGMSYIYFDKGYDRSRAPQDIGWLEYWRLSVNGHQPIGYLKNAVNDRTRADQEGLDFKPWRTGGRYILLDGSSGKHYYFHSDEDFGSKEKGELTQALAEKLHEVSMGIIERIRKEFPKFPIIYRPKPSFKYAIRINGNAGGEPIQWSRNKSPHDDLAKSHCVITAGSNLCFDAACFGVPSIVLGDGIAQPISSTDLSELADPLKVDDKTRRAWLNNAAWCQFKLEEIKSGLTWKTILEMMKHCQ